ncbi:MAG: cytochrome c [Myxococcales bacterium]|nr:cytochrome c [Myxococcales bacterium]
MMRSFLLAGIVLSWIGACASHRVPEPALAEVHSAQLRSHMGELGNVVLTDLSSATRGPVLRQDLVRIAEDLRAISARLPDVVYSLDLDADDRAHFVTFADSLGGSAARLSEAAVSAPPEIVEARIDDVTKTCAGCHWAFRVGPGS